MREYFHAIRVGLVVATAGLLLGGCASATYHDPFDRSASPAAQSVMGEAPAGPSVKVVLAGSTAASMKQMADFSNLGAEMLNTVSMIDPIDPKHIQDELNQVLEPHFRSIEYVYWDDSETGQQTDYTLTLEISINLAKHSFSENVVDLTGVLTGRVAGQKEHLAGHGSSKMGFPASLKSFTEAKEAAFSEFAQSLNGSTLLAAFDKPAPAPVESQAVAAAASSVAAATAPPPVVRAPQKPTVRGGVYDVESKITFNVLDSVYYDATSGQFALIGHHDDRYKNQGIPYLQYLATLLECPKPEFSLKWTPDSIRRVDSLLSRELTQQESDAQAARLGDMVDGSGNINQNGALMLPALGISPISGKRAPGDLGVEVASSGNGQVVVMKLKPGSAADRAGLKLIDFIYSVRPDRCVFFKSEFERQIRFAGAGSTVKITYYRHGQWYTTWATLDAAADPNPWRDVNRYDLIGLLYRAAGDSGAADVIEMLGIMNSMIAEKEPYAGLQIYSALMDALGMTADYKHLQAVQASGPTPYQESYNFGLRVSQQLDATFHFPGSPMQGDYLASVRQTNNPATAISAVFDAFGGQMVPKVGELIDRLIFRPGVGFQIPPELVEQEYHIHPEMTPEYLGVPGNSQLARLMFDGDYLCKQLTNRQDLKGKIPGYQTQVEYQINHPDPARPSSSAYRMWTSIAGVDAAQSPDGRTLAVRGARMRFNMRQTDGEGIDLPNRQPDGYGDFLTGLYDPLEQEFPELHEGREAAKLAAVAAWMKQQSPTVCLPLEGRADWEGPETVKGLVYIYLTQNLQRESKVIKIAEGGWDLYLKPFPFPVDPSVVDLRGNPSFATWFSKPEGASAGGADSAGTSPYVAGWVAPVTGGTPGQQAVVLQPRPVGVASAFGSQVSNPTLAGIDKDSRKAGADTSANHQLNAVAMNAKALAGGPAAPEAGSDNAQLGFDTGTAKAGAVDASGIATPSSEPEEIQIPASMLDDKDLAADMLKLNFYKQQAKQSRDTAAAAQEKFDAEKKKDPQSAQLPVLLVQAREAQDKAGNLDNMVKVKTREIRKRIDTTVGAAPALPGSPAASSGGAKATQ